jgi:hypothetical protein
MKNTTAAKTTNPATTPPINTPAPVDPPPPPPSGLWCVSILSTVGKFAAGTGVEISRLWIGEAVVGRSVGARLWVEGATPDRNVGALVGLGVGSDVCFVVEGATVGFPFRGGVGESVAG